MCRTSYIYTHSTPTLHTVTEPWNVGNESDLRDHLFSPFTQIRKLRSSWEKTCPRLHVNEQQSQDQNLGLLLFLVFPITQFFTAPSLTDSTVPKGRHSPQAAHLDHLGVKALAHLSAAMSQQYRAICVHMNQGSCLREEKDARHKIQ